jgi:hypothetical protein
MFRLSFLILACIFTDRSANAQESHKDSIVVHEKIPETDSVQKNWAYSATLFGYFVPVDRNFLSGIAYADHGSLHLEGRYNYEDINTASLFAGWRFEFGKKLTLSLTPMAGFLFGSTNGFIPALEFEASWKILDYYSETEYVLDFSNGANNYLYTWGELGVTPFSSFRTGICYQRTILYETGLDFQRGIFASYSFWKFTGTAYYFNPFMPENFLVVSLGIEF